MGNLINFYSPSAANINSLKVHFAPKQNLNGQTKPWPAGGGKNILNMDWFTATNSYISSTGATGNMSYYSYTDYLELAPNTYTISGVNNTVNSNLRIHSYDKNKEWVKQLASKYIAQGATFSCTFTVTSDDKYIRISAPAHTPEDPLLQLEVGSTATAYVPYENICPIEGWGSVEAYITGENLVPSTITTWYKTYPSGGKYASANVYSSFAIPVPAGNILVNNQKRSLSYVTLSNDLPVSGNSYSNPVTMTYRDSYIWDNSAGYKYMIFTTGRNRETETAFIENCQLSAYLITKTAYSDYRGQTYPITFPVLGKNKLNPVWESGSINTSTGVAQSGSNNIRLKDKIDVIPGKTYTLSWSSTGKNIFRFSYKKDGSFSRYLGLQSVSGQSFTFNNDEYYFWIFQYNDTNEPENIQLELGSAATTYEPYSSNNTIYGGYVDLVEGKVVQTFKQFSFKWSDGDKQSDIGSYYRRRFPVAGTTTPLSTTLNCCNIAAWYRNYSNNSLHFYNENNYAYVFLPKNTDENTDIILVLELATPIEYPISPQALQAFLGTNNIWSNTNSDTEISYDLYETSRLTTIKKRIIAAAPHVNTTSTANTVSFTTDMRAPLPQCKVSFAPRQGGSGTASPTNVRPIYGLKYLSVLNSGKNLIDVSTFTIGKGLNVNGQLQNWDSTMLSPYIPLPGGSYYISAISRASGSNNLRIHGFDENKQWIKQIIAVVAAQNAEYAGTFDFESSNIKYIRVSANINTENLQIEQGTTKSQYEPYSGGLWTADWESTAGEVYGGYVDLVTGEVWKTYGYYSNITAFTGAFGPTAYGYSVYLVFNDGDHFIKTPICDRFMYSIAGYTSMPVHSFGGCSGASVTFTFILDSTITSKEEADAWLANNPISVAYGLATPQLVTTLTPTQLLSFKGTNNLYASHNIITAKYWTH